MSTTILQLITLGLFSSLMAYQLGLLKKNFVINLLSFFDLKKILIILFCALGLDLYLILEIIYEEIINIYTIFYVFLFGIFIIQSIFNCLFISLLELNETNN